MIGRLSGRLFRKGGDNVIVDVGGVGYVVHVSDRTLSKLPAEGADVSLFTELLVREDLLQLFGFLTEAEKDWHGLLTSVQGIGAKGAMAILGALGPDGVASAIAIGDWAAIKAAPGVGPKIAQRVVNELREKAPKVMAQSALAAATPVDPGTTTHAEATSALGNLGYAPAEAARVVSEVLVETPDATTPDVIRAALKRLAPAGV
ncbi:MAG: Holliday junction branch migration protein RuvA [Pseudomonadota bacterium]